MRRLRVRPSKPASALAALVGIVFVAIGITIASYVFPLGVPWFLKGFVALWTVVSAGICLYHCANVFSARGVADEVIELDDQAVTSSPKERLQRLADLKAKGVITEDEYQDRRKTIVDQL